MENKLDYSYKEFLEASGAGNFDDLMKLLNSKGGINSRSEYGRTALMNFMTQSAKGMCEFLGKPYDNYENIFAKKLVELGADINLVDNKGYTALMFAHENNNVEMVEFLLSREGIELPKKNLLINYATGGDLEDRIFAAFVKAGYDIFKENVDVNGNERSVFAPVFSFEKLMKYHKGEDMEFFLYNNVNWYNYRKTLTAIGQLYPEKLPTIPPHYLETRQYDFILNDFLAPYPKIYGNKKRLQTFVKALTNGINSVDEYGRDLLSTCYIRLAQKTIDLTKFSKPQQRDYLPYQKDFTKAIEILISMGATGETTDIFGRTASDYKKILEEKKAKLGLV